MAAPISEHNHSFDGAGISKIPDRGHRIDQGMLDNSLLKLKENDFSNLLLRQLPEPVPARQAAVRATDAMQTGDNSARNHGHQRPDSGNSEDRISSQSDRQDRRPAKPDESIRSGDDLPPAKDTKGSQRQQEVNDEQDIGKNPPAEDKGVVSEGSATDTDPITTENTLEAAEISIAADEKPNEEEPNEQEQEKTANHARPVNTMDGHPLNSPALAVSAEGKGEQGEPEHSLFNLNRTVTKVVSGSGADTAGQEEAEVTREFKELGKSLAANQLAPAAGAMVMGSPQAERSELQRLALPESGLRDKVALTPPQNVVMRSAPAVSASSSTYVTNIPTQVQTPEWQQGVVKKLLWFVSEKIQSAKIHVNPPELGPVDLKIQVSKDQAQVQIQSPHAVVRDLLEGTAIRLREMLANQGIDLTNFNVGSQGGQTKQEGGSQPHSQTADTGSDSRLEAETHVSVQSQGINQIVDYYV